MELVLAVMIVFAVFIIFFMDVKSYRESKRLTEAEWLINNAHHERGYQSEEWWARFEQWRESKGKQ